jgi:hypothetical protein
MSLMGKAKLERRGALHHCATDEDGGGTREFWRTDPLIDRSAVLGIGRARQRLVDA